MYKTQLLEVHIQVIDTNNDYYTLLGGGGDSAANNGHFSHQRCMFIGANFLTFWTFLIFCADKELTKKIITN